jgi:para-nitrobenzyl esterase
MIDYWVGFASTGVPRSTGAPAWPDYGPGERYMRFAAIPFAETDPVSGMFELQEEIARRRRCKGEPWFTNLGPAAPSVALDKPEDVPCR